MSANVSAAPRAPAAGRVGTVLRWIPQVAVALLIGGGGLAKLAGDPAMVQMFADIGVGQWLRYLVGGLEVAGAIGLLVPRLVGLAALGIAALMVGATFTNVVVLATSPAITLILLVVAGSIAWVRRARIVPWRSTS